MLIIVSVVVCALMGSFGRYVISANRQSMILSLCYSGIDKGLNPDGSRFNIFELKSDAVLNAAIQKVNIQGLTVDYLRNRIDIFSRVPSNAAEKVKQANTAGSGYSYIPSEYTISYSQKAKFSKNHTLDMLKALSEAYTEYFNKNYTEKNTVLKLDDLKDINTYEYVEIADLYSNKITSMINYLQTHKKENVTYTASKTNQSFGDLIERLTNMQAVDVAKYKTYIIKSSLVKDKDTYLKKLQHTIDEQEVDYQKSMQASDFTANVIAKYDPSITGVLYIPSIDSDKQFYMNRTQTGLDYLTKDAYSEGDEAKKIKESIDHNKYLLQTFSNASPTPQETSAGTATANKMLKQIDEELSNISKSALATDNEYLEYKTANYLKFSLPETQMASFVTPGNIIKYGLLGLLIAVAYIALKYIARKFKENAVLTRWINLYRQKRKKTVEKSQKEE